MADEIKGGTYRLAALRWDRPTSKPGEPFLFERFRKGDVIGDVTDAEARRLVPAGALVPAETPAETAKTETATKPAAK